MNLLKKSDLIDILLSVLIVVLLLPVYIFLPSFPELIYAYLFLAYLETLVLPSFIISLLSKHYKEYTKNCMGLPSGGKMIGYAERSFIFLVFLAVYLEKQSLTSIFSYLTFIIAGKAIFRFSSKESGQSARACADWYILGTFLSVLLGLFLTWLFFKGIR
ncbi:MAG: hypothetical protein ACP6IS_10285 [Candidatus Asgardarchaeia archaeon]